MIPSEWQCEKELKSLLMRVKEVREKAVLKQHSKYKDHGIQSDHFMTNRLGKEYIKAVYCHPTYLTYMQSTS